MTRRSGSSLAGVIAFCLGAASLLAWLLLSLAWSYESLSAASLRAEERAALLSHVEVCRRWVRAQLAAGSPPRVRPEDVTGEPDSRKLFESRGADGASAAVYDLDPAPSGPPSAGNLLPSCPMGLMIRARRPGGPFPHFTVETVWVTRDVLRPDGTVATVLDERPLIWRESWM